MTNIIASPRIRQRTIDDEKYQAAVAAGADELVAKIAAARDWADAAHTDFHRQIRPPLSELDPPERLADLEAGAQRLATAIMSGEQIAIETDFDADGCTSHAVIQTALVNHFRVPESRVHSFIGHRLQDGYGLSAALVDRMLATAPEIDLVVTADNGSADEPRIRYMSEMGIDTIVTDHHEIPAEGVPASAFACINPTRTDCDYPDKLIAGCMVAWLLMTRVRRLLIEYGHLPAESPSLANLLDYVAVGTVADCVSIARSANNRAVIQAGLQRINAGSRPAWLVARENIASEGLTLTEVDVAFGLAPRINARGRLDGALAGVHYLTSPTIEHAEQWWGVLDAENETRKSIEREMKAVAMDKAQQAIELGRQGIAVWLPEGHPGVHGIVASRVVERFGHPTVCISPVHKSTDRVTGSARGVPGFHVKAAFDHIAAATPDLFEKFGGHEGAGGLTLQRNRLDELIIAWDQAVAHQLAGRSEPLAPVVWTDGALQADPSLDVLSRLDTLRPFGREFEEPVFEGVFPVLTIKPRGDGSHLYLALGGEDGVLDAIWFNAVMPGATHWPVQKGRHARVAYRIDNNRFRGRDRLQLRIVHAESLDD